MRSLARLSASKKTMRLCHRKTKQNKRRKTCFVTRAMTSLHITSGMQSTAVKTRASSMRPRRVHWPKKGAGPWYANRPENDQGQRHVHLPNNTEEPMKVDPTPDEEEPTDVDPPPEEVDPPLTGQAWCYPEVSLLSTMQEQQARHRSAWPAPYVQCSLHAHHSLGQNHCYGLLVGSPSRHCRNK